MVEVRVPLRKRLSSGAAATVVLAAMILGVAGCSLFDWDDEEMPEGYRVSPVAARQPRQTAADRGRMHLEENRIGLAIDAYLVALVNEGRTVDILNGLGIAYDLLGRFDLSRQYYREALSLDSESVRTLNNLGRSYSLERNYLEAIRYYEQAMALDPANEIVLSNIGEARIFTHRPPRMAADASDPNGGPGAAPRLPWVQFDGPGDQTLVTQADPTLIDALRKTELKPQLAAPAPLTLAEAQAGGALPTVSPARHASVASKGADGASPSGDGKPVTLLAGPFAAFVPVAIASPAVTGTSPAELVSAVEGAAVAPATVINRGAGRYRVQLAALRTSEDAERTRLKLRSAQGDILDRLDLTIERADLGPERGVYYRVQTSPLSVEEEAKNLCRSFSNRGQNCFVVRT